MLYIADLMTYQTSTRARNLTIGYDSVYSLPETSEKVNCILGHCTLIQMFLFQLSLLDFLCSTAGMRSGKHAAKLKQEGMQVKNLKGSIIAWVRHSSRPMAGQALIAHILVCLKTG